MFCKRILLAAALGFSMGPAGAAIDYYSAVPVTDLEIFFGTAPGAISAISPPPAYDPAVEGSGIKDSFEFVVGDVVSFDYNFMTDELGSEAADDYAFVSIGGQVALLDHVLGSPPFVSYPYERESGYLSFSYDVQQSGVLDFGIGIVDAFDEIVDSALLIDNIKVTRGASVVYQNGFEMTDPLGMAIGDMAIGTDLYGIGPTEGSYQALISTAAVPLPPAVWLLFSGMAALMGLSRRRNG